VTMPTSRELSVAHQAPGECKWCDERYEKIRKAFKEEHYRWLKEKWDRRVNLTRGR
jgi:hypothetical protein